VGGAGGQTKPQRPKSSGRAACPGVYLSFRPVFPQPQAGAAAIGVDELYTGTLQGPPYCSVIWGGQRGLSIAQFGSPDCRDAYLGFASQVFRSPAKKRPCSPDLTGTGREGPAPAVAGEAGRGRPGGPVGRSWGPSARSIGTARASLWFGVLSLRFPKSDSCSATVFLDEFDAGGLDGFPESDSDFIRHSRTETSLQALNRRE
jgi:hypothetical protein